MIDAFELKRKGYYKQAIEIFYKLLAKENDNIEILSELGGLYFLLGNFDRALHYTGKALDIDENHVNSLNTLKNIHQSKKDYISASKVANKIYIITNSQESLAEFIKLLNIQEKYNEATGFTDMIESDIVAKEVAVAYHKLENYKIAIELLTKYTDIENKEVLNILCEIYFKSGDKIKAKEVLKKLDNKEIEDIQTLNYMGLAKLDELKLDEAIDCFNKIIEKDSKNDEYFYNLGQAYFLKGWLNEAKKAFINAICLNPNNENYHYSMGYALYREGDYKNATTHLSDEHLESKVLKMMIKFQEGDMAKPKVELEKLLNTNPDNEIILYSLAQIYSGLGLLKQSLTMISKVVAINPNSFDYKSFEASLMIKLKMFEEVKPKIDELVKAYPKYYYAKVLLTEYLYATKDFESLFDTAQEMIDLDLNQYEGYYFNALALLEKNDINFAIHSLKKAITLNVNNATLYVKMSEIYQALGQYENAFEYIKEASDIDKSAKNKELYMQLANIIRKSRGKV